LGNTKNKRWGWQVRKVSKKRAGTHDGQTGGKQENTSVDGRGGNKEKGKGRRLEFCDLMKRGVTQDLSKNERRKQKKKVTITVAWGVEGGSKRPHGKEKRREVVERGLSARQRLNGISRIEESGQLRKFSKQPPLLKMDRDSVILREPG